VELDHRWSRPADPSLYSNVERAVAKSTGSVIFLEVSDKGLAVTGVCNCFRIRRRVWDSKELPGSARECRRSSARRFGGIAKMISEISSLNRAAALATIHARVSLAFDTCLFLLLVDCDTVWFRSVSAPPTRTRPTDCTPGSRIAQIRRTGASKEFNISFRFLRYGGYAFSIRLNLAGSVLRS
jgi:hypothetical protein